MRKTIYAKMTALPVGLCALAFAVTSCGSSEYKKFADNEGKQVASIPVSYTHLTLPTILRV